MLPGEDNPRIRRVGFELRASGVRPEAANPTLSGIHTRGYLPHVKREGSSYFVTFRLADSLPKELLLKIQSERAERLQRLPALTPGDTKSDNRTTGLDSLEAVERDYRRKFEQFLDRGCGECWLRRPDLADLVANAIRHFEGERYLLRAWVVMPNHVHAALWPMPNHSLSVIVQSWKRFTARQANQLLDRTGHDFWQPESFDHWIRNDVEHARCCRYVVNNPVKAGLCAAAEDWKWSSAWRERKRS
jgi:REP element-mobilizing transposase RayT